MPEKDNFYPRFYYKDNKLKQLKGFVAVVRHLSIKKAAEELNLTHGAVSTQISSLEKQLGCNLFIRNNNKIKLTKAGKQFYVMAVEKLQGVDDLYKEFILQNTAQTGSHIKIAGHSFVLSHYLNSFLQEIISKCKDKASLTILNIPREEASQRLVNEEIDLMLYDIDENYNPAIQVKPWICDEFVAILPKNHVLTNKIDKEITWSDIAKLNLIKTGDFTVENENFTEQQKFISQVRYINPNYEICKNAALTGLGITFCPESYILKEEAKNVKLKRVSHLVGFYKATIGTKKNTTNKPIVEELINMMV